MNKILKHFKDFMSVDNDVCNVCASERPIWSRDIEAQMLKEYPDVWPDRFKGLPANHPAWFRSEELWKIHHIKCLCFAYDDLSFSLCRRHLKELSKVLD